QLNANRLQSQPSQATSLLTPLPVPDPTTSRLGDSAMASASRSRRPSSECSMEDICRSPKPSGQLPHTSSRVTLRSKAGSQRNSIHPPHNVEDGVPRVNGIGQPIIK
ncbi:mCG146188, partial [Mus musculus]